MKKVLSFLIVFSCIVIKADAQIFMNTGKKSMEKMKEDASVEKAKSDSIARVAAKAAAIEAAKKQQALVTKPATPVKADQQATTKPAAIAKPTTTKPEQPAASKPVPASKPKKSVASKSVEIPAAPVKAAVAKEVPPVERPSFAEAGKCYAKSTSPDKFEVVEEMVIDKPASVKTKLIPAKYKLVSDTIVITPATVKYVGGKITYETITQDVLVMPDTFKWVRMKYDSTCVSKNPDDCNVLVYKFYPAVYKKVSKKNQKPSSETKEVPVPAVYKVIQKKVIAEPAREEKEEIQPTYKKLMRKQLVYKGGDAEWKEILCDKDVTKDRVLFIQKALRAAGYEAGTPDGNMGAQTKIALMKYQRDRSLPIGNLDVETLNALGVK